ncbi:helix-turn-helix domain-containing protein [Actinomadura rubrisoli]|uniref:XRE family transcriptional regulator n=1 Tax=Actinomadura rubrisoli TaxID=2530368 RepID=A0A4R5CB54_9ACTN|nr:helix-turn-helix transcriptional regulator [Actinomadura rubrisoli]TDD95423.1 XRE family transcriptional regulator [Actinomadura rubrisoli]
MSVASLGERIQAVRKRRGLTQRDLATLSGVSLGLVRKLEQGEREDTRLETLRKLATALRVPTTELVVRPDADDAPQETLDQWAPVRAALVGKAGPEPEEAPTASGVALAAQNAMPLFAQDAFTELGLLLPALIRDADALGKQGRQIRSRVLHLTGWLLTQTRQFDAAEMALQRALDDSADRLDTAATVNTWCWLLIRQGKLEKTLNLSAQWADETEPRMSRATLAELSAWGWLLLRHSTASVRNSEPGEADDALSLAGAAATRMGREFAPPADFLRTFGPVTVAMKRAENAMIEDHPDVVLSLSEQIPSEGLLPTSNNRNRHRLDVAKANVKLRRRSEAFEILQEIRNASPQWIVNQRMARDIMGNIVAKRRTLTPEMREMADFLRLEF